MPTSKRCTVCSQDKPLDDFHICNGRGAMFDKRDAERARTVLSDRSGRTKLVRAVQIQAEGGQIQQLKLEGEIGQGSLRKGMR